MLCKHSNYEIFTEERGYWGQCHVCGGVGPIKESTEEAKTALKRLRVDRPHNQGGARKGAGRKKTLPDDATFKAFTLAGVHTDKIDAFVKRHNEVFEDTIRGRSAGLRTILEAIDVDKLVASL